MGIASCSTNSLDIRMIRSLLNFFGSLHLIIFCLIAASHLSAKEPDAEAFARESVQNDSAGFFAVTSYRETDRRTKNDMCEIRFEVVAELQRDAVTRIGFSGPQRLSLTGLAEPALVDSVKATEPAGDGFQVWHKGAKLQLEGARTYVKYDEGWKPDRMWTGLSARGPNVLSTEIVGDLSKTPTSGVVTRTSASSTPGSVTPAIVPSAPKLPDAEILAAKVTEFAAIHLKGLQKAEALKIVGPATPALGSDGSARCTLEIQADFSFLQPTVYMDRNHFFPLPKVGEPCPTGTRMEIEQSRYWDTGAKLPYTGVILLTKGPQESDWSVTVQSVTQPKILPCSHSMRIAYKQTVNLFILTDVKIVPRP
ncbi:MAG: hypothetical protein ABI387_01975 [Lacunisphaera sp.]